MFVRQRQEGQVVLSAPGWRMKRLPLWLGFGAGIYWTAQTQPITLETCQLWAYLALAILLLADLADVLAWLFYGRRCR